MKKSVVLLSALIAASILRAQPCGPRYLDSLFSSVSISTFQFDSQPNYQNDIVNLLADAYTPDGDTSTHRALIIFLHGGSFIFGSRSSGNIPILCDQLAKKGYVVASIDYRTGINDTSPPERGRAQLRAIQDCNSFIRYMKAHASNWGIDTNKIFATGSSAGGVASLYTQYLDYDELPFYIDTIGVGTLEGYGNLNGTSASVLGAYSLWGAVADTSMIEPGDVPVGCIQSIDDPCVPWVYSPSSCHIPGAPIYGSYAIYSRATHLGIFSTVHGFNSDIHDLGLDSLPFLDTTVIEFSNFCYTVLCGFGVGIQSSLDNEVVKVFPNPFSSEIKIEAGSDFNFVLYDQRGIEILHGRNKNEINASSFAEGIYLLKVFSGQEVRIIKLVK